MNGSYLNNAFIEKRNVVISFAMRGIGIEKRRHQLYHVVKPSRYIKIWYKTANIDVYAEGYVETCEVSNFEQQISGQISILCPDIYWYSRDIFYAYYSGITGAFHFPFPESDAPFPLGVYSNSNLFSITNDGDETGFTLRIEALPSDIPQEVVAVTPTIYNENGEYLQIKGDILTGDVITVTTKTGNKTVTLTRNGVDSNILNRLVSGSTWLTLEGRHKYLSGRGSSWCEKAASDIDAPQFLSGSVRNAVGNLQLDGSERPDFCVTGSHLRQLFFALMGH
ncbi:phage tail family protein [Ruminococcus sp.]|uniref:phage tail family protein n=1 Tax=Ruminococcus sp. TaxID=41978 RepID=UPI00399108EA